MDPDDFTTDFETNLESGQSSHIEDTTEGSMHDPKTGYIINLVMDRFKKAEDARFTDEQRWMDAYRNYRGIYNNEVQFTETEKSRVFVKVTKTKMVEDEVEVYLKRPTRKMYDECNLFYSVQEMYCLGHIFL